MVLVGKLSRVVSVMIGLFLFRCGDSPAIQQTTDEPKWDPVSASFYLKDSLHRGEATFYGIAAEGGNCMLPSPSPWDTMAGAMNRTDYHNSEICGACVMVQGPTDSVLIRINDQCPECKEGDIDLTPNAFEHIGPKALGRMPITWHFVPCPVQGSVKIYFDESSSVWWAGLQVRNHRNPVRSLEVFLIDSGWVDITRKSYNRFESSAMPQPPWILRIRDVFGAELIDSAVPLLKGNEYKFSGQFAEP